MKDETKLYGFTDRAGVSAVTDRICLPLTVPLGKIADVKLWPFDAD